MNNRREAERFIKFMDGFEVPYTMVFGNHDCEMGAVCGKDELADIFMKGRYCIFSKGIADISGTGNFIINLTDDFGNARMPLVMLDSNMYGDGWFFSGFDCIHDDQTKWCMDRLDEFKAVNKNIRAMAFSYASTRIQGSLREDEAWGQECYILPWEHRRKGRVFWNIQQRRTFLKRR